MDNYQKLEQLLLAKDYEQLNETERHFLLNILTETEYRKMRNNMQILKDFLDREAQLQHAPKSVEDSVMDSFEEHHQSKQSHFDKKIWVKRSVPLWAVAASITLLIIAGGWLMQWKPQTRITYLTKIDTVFQEKHVIDTVYIEKELLKTQHNTKAQIASQTVNMETPSSSNNTVAATGITVPNPEMLRNTKRFPVGTSMSEDATKDKLTVEIY